MIGEKQGEQKPTLRERYKNIAESEWFKKTHDGMSVSNDEGMIEALRTEYEKGRHDVIEKTSKWLWDLNQEHEIMSYTDSHVLSSEELQKYYKNNIEE